MSVHLCVHYYYVHVYPKNPFIDPDRKAAFLTYAAIVVDEFYLENINALPSALHICVPFGSSA
ncbi:hypothetical protein BBO01nite_43250 [Brevibacillus borstelensis]|nr:hypothetical protein BBO01nite_43250 [Brevibacillus borstelensis]